MAFWYSSIQITFIDYKNALFSANFNFDFKLNVQGSLNKFLEFFRMGTFSDSTHMKL